MDSNIHVVIRLADGNVAIVYQDRRVVVVKRDGTVTREDARGLARTAPMDEPRDRHTLH